MPPRHQRQSTPHPTHPPPLRDEPSVVKRLATGIEPWKAVLGILVVAVGVGATAITFANSKADVAEVHQVRDGAAAALGSAQASTGAQLGTLQATVQDLRARQAGVDASLAALTTDVARLNRSADSLYLQLVEIARATGARRVPAPEPEPVTRPP